MPPPGSPSITGPPDDFGALIADAKGGSTEVLGHLLELSRDYLLGVANDELESALLPKGGASDLVQESFLEATRIFARFEGNSRQDLLRWLRGVLVHKLSEFRRHYRGTDKRHVGREVRLEGAGEGGAADLADRAQTPSIQLSRAEDAAAVRRALDALPQHYRDVIIWREWEGVGFEEIGRRTGRGADAARMLFWRAVERLGQELGPESGAGSSGPA